ncbi:hypothetical protein D917_10366 [Trichinella nativa]|uniref:Uncharacterized protein n=2 Tax=Trichinella nativa TaxID=6335 RepID=A0A1Y3EB38_9BILA|nr:hypothetical protein D917_10366 [Trichinella nativa]
MNEDNQRLDNQIRLTSCQLKSTVYWFVPEDQDRAGIRESSKKAAVRVMLRRESKAGDCPNASVETSHPSVLLSAVHYKSNL